MKKILLFPLSNVLGHLTRTFAVAEEFNSRGDEVHLVLSRSYGYLKELLSPRIRLHSSPEMFAVRSGAAGLVACYESGPASDRENLLGSGKAGVSELRRRGLRLKQMLLRDSSIVAQVRPDAIVTDYRFTPALMPPALMPPALIGDPATRRLFHIANIVGFPSFYRRVTGTLPYPLASAPLLVPGIREIEYGGESPSPADASAEILCGMFHWNGWAKMKTADVNPSSCPPSDLFLFFGSTGGGGRIVPWLLRQLPSGYVVSGLGTPAGACGANPGLFARRGDPEIFLRRTRLALCHGGHGTVMQCLRNAVPMLIFPRNLEQLEIGRQVERLGLGILMKKPYSRLTPAELASAIEQVRTDRRYSARAEKFASRLSARNGARRAVSAVHRAL